MGLRILLDQNVSVQVAFWLRKRQPAWQIEHTSEIGLSAKTDREIFLWAQSNKAIIITFDEDFADQRNFPAGTHNGIIRLKIWPTTIEETILALEKLFEESSEEE